MVVGKDERHAQRPGGEPDRGGSRVGGRRGREAREKLGGSKGRAYHVARDACERG